MRFFETIMWAASFYVVGTIVSMAIIILLPITAFDTPQATLLGPCFLGPICLVLGILFGISREDKW